MGLEPEHSGDDQVDNLDADEWNDHPAEAEDREVAG